MAMIGQYYKIVINADTHEHNHYNTLHITKNVPVFQYLK